ncbi:DUF6397 family protein [Streptomyces sp. UNOC14_S4]|uniref:DUF6397 family protein n=1 Tax=Streptomyces sp. UNOC14_S4 TaxID=2872340 RepID=UPI001E642FF9|nr:DUF6397 family protein [Streptomyces sp. UNOC14_S4]MCC3771437.1 hypothetical protein [Streptomyces sp. UNOC14_S4]
MTVRQHQEQGTAVAALPFGRAARELGLRPREFDLAVQLGHVRTVASGPGGRRRVTREEIERHTGGIGFPEALRARVWVVGTAEGAELMGVGPARFVRLARAGCFAPVRFYVNRYRAVVWHYLAADLAEFADANPGLLTGRAPAELRATLERKVDSRPRAWRARRVDQLLALTQDPWGRAAVIASVLRPEQLTDTVPDPFERAHVGTLRPLLALGRSDTVAGREIIDRMTVAAEPDEIEGYRNLLTATLAEARALRAAPRPESERPLPARSAPPGRAPSPAPVTTAAGAPEKRKPRPKGPRTLWGLFRRRSSRQLPEESLLHH